MDIFIISHSLAMGLLVWFLASATGVGAAYMIARAFWKALAPHAGPTISIGLGLVWYMLWAVPLAVCVGVLISAGLIDFGAQEWQVPLLVSAYQFYGLGIFALCIVGVGGLFVYQARHAVLPTSLTWYKTLWHVVRIPLLLLAGVFVLLVLLRIPAVKIPGGTDAAAAIHAKKLSLASVMGDALPQQPYVPESDATVAGVDKNNNGIRDDVELAIFTKYPNSAKIRAAELQYAMTEQMFLTDVSNTETWKAVAEESSRAFNCISETYPRDNMKKYIEATDGYSNEVEEWVFNTQLRTDARNKAYNFVTSHGDASGKSCDIDLNSLPN